MAGGRSQKNNIVAGIFVLSAIALGVIVVVILSGLDQSVAKGSTPYIIRFSLRDGAPGLDDGSVVTLGGKKIGRVVGTSFAQDSEGRIVGIDVAVRVRSDVPLTTTADVRLIRPLLGTLSTINIAGLTDRDPATPDPVAPPGSVIDGVLGPPAFLAEADYERIQAIITRVDSSLAEIEPRIKPIMDDVQGAVASVREVSTQVNRDWAEWSGRVDSVLTRADEASKELEAIAVGVRDGVQEARDLVASGRRVIEENRPGINQTVENVRVLTERARTEGLDRVMAALQKGEETLAYARDTARQIDELVTARSPQLHGIIADASLAAQQLKLTTVEVRAAPWRLLYQPDKKELENELLYNSVRAYSESVSELRAAAEALNALAARQEALGPAASPISRETVQELTGKLNAAFDQYREQERKFFERWVDQGR